MTALETNSVCSSSVPQAKGAQTVALPPVPCPGEGSVAGRCSTCRGKPGVAWLAWLHRVCKGSRDPGELAQAETPASAA